MSTVFPHGARLRIIGEIHGSQTVNVLHFGNDIQDVDLPTAISRLGELAQDVVECVVTHLLPVVTVDWKFIRCEAQMITPFETDPVVVNAALPNVGGGGEQGVTISSTLVQLRTGRDGRKGRGRMFLPPGGENHIALGDWDALWLAAVVAFLGCMSDKFKETGGTSSWKWGVLSRKDFESVGGTWSNSFRVIQTATAQPLAASMRTRKKGRGA